MIVVIEELVKYTQEFEVDDDLIPDQDALENYASDFYLREEADQEQMNYQATIRR